MAIGWQPRGSCRRRNGSRTTRGLRSTPLNPRGDLARLSTPDRPVFGGTVKRPRLARWQAMAVWGAWVAALVLVLLGLLEARSGSVNDPAAAAQTLLVVLSTVTVGAVLVTRLPRHIVGWLLLAGGLSVAISTPAAALADYGLNVHPGSVPGAVWIAVLGEAASGPFVGLIGGFVPLYFPTGRLPSPRWRVMLPIAIVPTALPGIVSALSPFTPGMFPRGVENPLALGGWGGDLVAVLNTASTVLAFVALLLVIASLVVRYRRASGIERQQLRWFAAVALVTVLALVIAVLTGGFTSGPLATVANVAWIGVLLGFALLPVTIAIAVLRYRLYEIDRLISRTISYGVLTVVVGGLFVGFILVFQAVLAPVTRSNQLAVAGSTLFVFSLFQPLRRRIQRIVDRRFNRARYDAERIVAAFAGRLGTGIDIVQLRTEITATLTETVEPVSVSLWLRA